MIWARSLAFNFTFFAWTVIAGTIGLPSLVAPRAVTMQFGRFWARIVLVLLRAIVGLDHEIRGLDHVPSRRLHRRDEASVRVGYADPARLCSAITQPWQSANCCSCRSTAGTRPAPDRSLSTARQAPAHCAAWSPRLARSLLKGARSSFSQRGRGSHRAPASRISRGSAPSTRHWRCRSFPPRSIPVYFWGRRSFVKRPGRIVLEFLEPIPPGWPRRRVMAELEQRIETATAALLREAEASHPTSSLVSIPAPTVMGGHGGAHVSGRARRHTARRHLRSGKVTNE